MRRRALLFLLPTLVAATQARDDEALWRLLKAGGQVVLMRHDATTPERAIRMAWSFMMRHTAQSQRRRARPCQASWRSVSARGVHVAQVLSSPWCRCLETARLAFSVESGSLHGFEQSLRPQ
jgi:hypothetical protein